MVKSQLPEAIALPSGAKATHATSFVCPRNSRTWRPVARSQSRTTLSLPPETIVLPSGEKATALIPSPWRKRAVPQRAMAPGGSGSPWRSVRGFGAGGGSANAGCPTRPVRSTASRSPRVTPAIGSPLAARESGACGREVVSRAVVAGGQRPARSLRDLRLRVARLDPLQPLAVRLALRLQLDRLLHRLGGPVL